VKEVRITYNARPDATPESDREVLANIYAFVLRTHQERQKTSPSGRPEDAEGSPDDPGASPTTCG
jgi:hypothetical protein